jgi:hypothetical protein
LVAEIGPHALVFKASAVAPVLDPPAAWCSKEIIDNPEDNDGAKVREWVFYGGDEQAAVGHEKENKKLYESHVFAFLLQQTYDSKAV